MSVASASCTEPLAFRIERARGPRRARAPGQSARSARAMAMRCRCPPESFTPRSPVTVSKPCRQPLDELERVRPPRGLADLLAAWRPAARRRCSPRSCGGTAAAPAARRPPGGASDCCVRVGHVLPVHEDAPPPGCRTAAADSFVSVVFPAPLMPTSPTRSPGGDVQVEAVEHLRLRVSPSAYQKPMSSKIDRARRSPAAAGAPGTSATSRGSSRIAGHAATRRRTRG